MTAYSTTVSNKITPLGGGVTTKWNSFLWGTGKWGEGSTGFLERDIFHIFTSPCVASSTNQFAVSKFLDDSVVPDTGNMLSVYKMLTDSLGSTSNPDDIRLRDGSGYTYVFPSNALDALERDDPTYSSGVHASTTWSSSTASTISWSSI